MTRRLTAALALGCALMLAQREGTAQRASTAEVHATTVADLRSWDTFVTQNERAGRLRTRAVERDRALPGRTVERLDQMHEGVRIWGAEIVRDAERGVPHSIFGQLSREPALSVQATLDVESAAARLARSGGRLLKQLELTILPLDSGEHRLAYTSVVSGVDGIHRVFIDANTGAELLKFNDLQTQAAVGSGPGVLGDTKKLSVFMDAGLFTADDQHRPPVLRTYDMRGNLSRAVTVLDGATLFGSDRASDTDNNWTDVVAVDAHAHIGWTYDYYFKRHGRRGLDNRDRPTIALINALTQQDALTAPTSAIDFVLNAFWCGACGPGGIGVMFFGNGMPPGYYFGPTGQNHGYLAGSLDVIAHELTHGVIDSSSRLIYRNESGALNEAFADMMGTATEFFYQPAGSGPRQADYLIGEDTIRGVTTSLNGIRSMSQPSAFDDPDHYSRRYTGTGDNGGVHINSGIPNQAFYLAIEGGTNRTSGVSVQGVGAANREQIEKVFYRAFVFLLPTSATFSTARVATIQAARDLYGSGSAVERAVTQAWTAVGVS